MFVFGDRICALWVGMAIASEPVGDPVDHCLADHEQAQLDRESGDLLHAHEALQRCTTEACPPLVLDDCTKWLAEVEAVLPLVEVVVLTDGDGSPPDELWIDDIEQSDPTGTRPLNPGEHRFRVRKSVDGHPHEIEITRTIEGVRGPHSIRIELGVPPPEVAASPITPLDLPARPRRFRGLWLAGTVVLGLGGPLAMVGIIEGGIALRNLRRARHTCAPFCRTDEVHSIHRGLLLADILVPLGAALTAAGIAMFVLGRRPRRTQRTTVQRRGLGIAF